MSHLTAPLREERLLRDVIDLTVKAVIVIRGTAHSPIVSAWGFLWVLQLPATAQRQIGVNWLIGDSKLTLGI